MTASRATVRSWDDGQGHGVLDSDATPGGCWTHSSALDVDGHRSLTPGEQVWLVAESPGQDGYDWRAVEVRTGTAPSSGTAAGDAYGSVLSVTWDEPLHATRAAYDVVAADYARLLPDLSVEAPLDRAVLRAFAEMVQVGPAVEVGCGTGRVTAHLSDAGLRLVGLDLSLGMVREARRARPDLAFAVAHAGALPVRSGAVGGLLAWYSLINLPSDALPDVAAEFARVTRPGAPVLLAFQCGDGERVERSTSYGHDVPLTYYRHRTSDVSDALEQAGLAVHATVQRRPQPSQAHESTPQACLLAQRTA